jgi:nitrogen-specific signal transduction histidine kinase
VRSFGGIDAVASPLLRLKSPRMERCMSVKRSTKRKAAEPEQISHLRALAHDLSNSLEAIMQASYLLGQAKLDPDNKRWAQLIETSSNEAARINREIRKALRALSGDE